MGSSAYMLREKCKFSGERPGAKCGVINKKPKIM